MARLIPPVEDLSEIANHGERLVAEALVQQLPDDVVVYHSFPWLRLERHAKTGADYLQPGEADFVILDPRWGLLVLEVKGSEVEYQPHTHRWRQKNRKTGAWHTIEPFKQAEENKYAITRRLEEHRVFSGPPPFTTGHAVVFPSHRFDGLLPADVDEAIVLGAESLRTMQRSVHRAFESWCRVRRPHPMDESIRGAILESLSPLFKLIPVLWRTVDQQEERLHRLTQNQEMALHMLASQERSVIEGVAGSGKTLLAVAQAQRLARLGKKTLLVCYNKPLAHWIGNNLPESYKDQITVATFHSICRTFCQHADVRFAPPKDADEFWRYEAADLLEKAAETVAAEHGYDAIVVDEGQDFADFWWMALEKLYRDPDGPQLMTVFLDPKQCIYLEKPMVPGDLGKPFHLPTNCRNTRKIAAYCADVLGFELVVHPDAPKGTAPKTTALTNLKAVIGHTRAVINDWCLRDRGGLRPNQVAILTPYNDHKRWPTHFGNLPIVRDFQEWRAGKGVLLATHRRFKGLEADALILAGVPVPGSVDRYSLADEYVAASRGKHLLEVVRV